MSTLEGGRDVCVQRLEPLQPGRTREEDRACKEDASDDPGIAQRTRRILRKGRGERFTLNAEEAMKQGDENTIGVVAILGSTFDGRYEPVEELARALDELEARKGWDVPIHVDAASGGFVAPFLQPELVWDFRCPE